MKPSRFAASLLLACCAVACGPKSPAPNVACTADNECFSGGVCIAGGVCRLGQGVDQGTSTIEVSQPTAVADGVDKVAITVTLKDAQGNPLGSRGVLLSVDGSGNTLTQPSLATNAVGQVTGTLVSTKAELKKISAVTGPLVGQGVLDKSLALTATSRVTFTADAGHLAGAGGDLGSSRLTISARDGSGPDVVADNVTPIVVSLALKDSHGNAVPNVPVFVNATGSSNTISPNGLTGADGTFLATIVSKKAEAKTLIVTADSLHSESTIRFHAGLAAATHTTVTSDKTTVSAVGRQAAIITVLAHDIFDNPCTAARVWFSSGATEVGNTFQPTAQQQEPATTGPDGSLQVRFSSPRAEPKNLTVHVDDLALPLPLLVTPGPVSPQFSQYTIVGNPDGSPVVADASTKPGAPAASFFVLNIYLADEQDNPIRGKSVVFASSEGTDRIAVPIDSTGATKDDGTFVAALSAFVAGRRTVTATVQDLGDIVETADFVAGPPDATKSRLTVSPSTVSTDFGNSAGITIILRDQNGNDAPQPLTLDADGLNNTFSLPANSGATFTAQLASSTAQTENVTVDVDLGAGVPPMHLAQPITFTAGQPSGTNSTVALAGPPGNPKADGVQTASFIVTVRDAQGNLVPGSQVNALVQPGSLSVSAVTDATGAATISFSSIKAETKTVTFRAGSAVLAQTMQVTFDPGLPSAGTSTLVADPPSIIDDGISKTTLTLTVRDAQGNPVPGVAMTFGSNAAAFSFVPATPITTDKNGVASVTYSTTSLGSQTLKATAGSSFSQAVTVLSQAGAISAANSSMVASPASAIADGSSMITLTVTEKDTSNNPIGGHAIAISGNGISATFSSGSTTDASGVVKATIVCKTAGPQTITASDLNAGRVEVATTQVTFTPGRPDPSATTFAAAPTSIPADNATKSTLTLTVKDLNQNPAPGVPVVFGASDPADSLSCSAGATGCTGGGTTISTATNASGLAIVQLVSKKTGSRPISATINGGTGNSFGKQLIVTVVPGAAAKLAFAQQPADVAAGALMAPIQLALQDAFGNAVPAGSATITLALSPAGTLSGATQSTVSGVATFNTLAVTNAAGVLSLVASASGLAGATSAPFNVIAPNSSNGADGPFAPSGSVTLPARVYNFTTINIPAGVRVTSDGNGILELRATGAVTINGVVDVSGGAGGSVSTGANGGGGGGGGGASAASNGAPGSVFGGGGSHAAAGSPSFSSAWGSPGTIGGGGLGGNGGGAVGGGGAGGSADSNADMNAGGGGGGGGPAGGAGGFAGADGCIANGGAGGGNGGGRATGCGASAAGGGSTCSAPYAAYAGQTGGIGASPCTTLAGSGGGGSIGCDAAADLAMSRLFYPGSGGGGGGNGGDSNEPGSGQISGGGGGGGGGGGALRIVSPSQIVLGSGAAVLANGGNGGAGAIAIDDCNDDSGGGGGGGSGGAIWLQAPTLVVPSGANVSAAGGTGGAAGATAAGAKGGDGGLGRIRLSIDPASSSIAGAMNPPPAAGTNPARVAGKAFVAHYPQ